MGGAGPGAALLASGIERGQWQAGTPAPAGLHNVCCYSQAPKEAPDGDGPAQPQPSPRQSGGPWWTLNPGGAWFGTGGTPCSLGPWLRVGGTTRFRTLARALCGLYLLAAETNCICPALLTWRAGDKATQLCLSLVLASCLALDGVRGPERGCSPASEMLSTSAYFLPALAALHSLAGPKVGGLHVVYGRVCIQQGMHKEFVSCGSRWVLSNRDLEGVSLPTGTEAAQVLR